MDEGFAKHAQAAAHVQTVAPASMTNVHRCLDRSQADIACAIRT